MFKSPAAWLLPVAFCLLLAPQPLFAGIKDLVMPGPVAQAHARYEKECERCHQPFKKSSQRQLCLNCHKTVGADLGQKVGFHGRSPAVAGVECRHCHTEHKGREADILQLDPETFDHQLADFKLEGGHRQQPCDQCHKPAERKPPVAADGTAAQGFYSSAPQECVTCHARIDPHQKRLGERCQDCHKSDSWRKVAYRHDKSDFRLDGMHRPVACVSCHPSQRWKKIAADCVSCHRLDDAHGGRYGSKCQDCHSAAGPAPDPQKPKGAWKKTRFDHAKTKFALEGKHIKLACNLCHSQQLYGQKLKTDCLSCHQKDDRHKGFYGAQCHTCHNPRGWQVTAFDHQRTRYPLAGKHLKVACSSCHTRPLTDQKLGTACKSCHQLEDVHRRQETSRCARCHTPEGWRSSVKFEHDLSRFPLLGLHAAVPCEGCHRSTDFRQVGLACIDCHAPDDSHKQALGRACETCHTPNGWKLWQFDHNKPKGFRLEGAHRNLECRACHKQPVKEKIELAQTCAACHQAQDVHRGAFGRNCERCHQSESFKKLRNSN